MSSLRLEVKQGEVSGSTVLTGISVLGRDRSCSVIIDDRSVSREHAMIRAEEGVGFVLEDLDSRGGTFVNGIRTRKAVLLDGDTIQIGKAILLVRSPTQLAGEVPIEDVEMVKTRHLPTQRLSLDAVRFRTSARFLKDTGRLGPPLDARLASKESEDPPAEEDTASLEPGGEEPETLLLGEDASEVARRLEFLCEITNSLAAIHEPSRLTRETALRILDLFPHTKRIGFFRLEDDPDGDGEQILRPTYLVDRASGEREGAVQISHSVLQQAVGGRQAILSQDVKDDPRFNKSDSLASLGIYSILCAPLCLGERTLGAVYVDTTDPEHPFDEGGLRVLTGVAAILAAAYENARLFAQVQVETVRRAGLERYFSPDLVERVMKGELPLAREGRLATGTILFVDIRGFSKLTLVTEPSLLVATLNAYFAAMQRIIFRSRGTVERFGGDSILAYWGIVDQDAHSSAHALRAAVAMQSEVFRLNPELRAGGKPELEIGIGLNTGPVIVGDVGSAERYEFTILGDAVNMARRFESLAPRGEIIAGSDTIASLPARSVLHVALPPTTVKGKEHAVTVSSVYGIRVDTGTTPNVRYDLAIPGELDLGSGPVATVVSGLELAPTTGAAALEVLTESDPEPGAPAVITLRLPRQEAPLSLKGRVLSGNVQDTLLLGPTLSVTTGGIQRIRVALPDPRAILWPMGLA